MPDLRFINSFIALTPDLKLNATINRNKTALMTFCHSPYSINITTADITAISIRFEHILSQWIRIYSSFLVSFTL